MAVEHSSTLTTRNRPAQCRIHRSGLAKHSPLSALARPHHSEFRAGLHSWNSRVAVDWERRDAWHAPMSACTDGELQADVNRISSGEGPPGESIDTLSLYSAGFSIGWMVGGDGSRRTSVARVANTALMRITRDRALNLRRGLHEVLWSNLGV